MWGGWYDEEHTLEIRRLRPVQPRAAIKVCTKMFGRPMVLSGRYIVPYGQVGTVYRT